MKRYLLAAVVLVAFFAFDAKAQPAFTTLQAVCTLAAGANQVHTEGGTCGGTADGSLITITDATAAGACSGTPGLRPTLCMYDLANNQLVTASTGVDVDLEDYATSGAIGTAPVSDGAGGLVMTDIATQAEIAKLISNIYWVDDFGAARGGSSGAETGMNLAIDAACAASGGVVALLENNGLATGAYVVGSGGFFDSVAIECSNIWVQGGDGNNFAEIRPSDLNTAGVDLMAVCGGTWGGTGCVEGTQIKNVTISGIFWHDDDPASHGDADADEQSHCVNTHNVDGLYFKNIRAKDIGDECLDLGANTVHWDVDLFDCEGTPSLLTGGSCLSGTDVEDGHVDRLRCHDRDAPESSGYCAQIWGDKGPATDTIFTRMDVRDSNYDAGLSIFSGDGNTHTLFLRDSFIRMDYPGGATILENGVPNTNSYNTHVTDSTLIGRGVGDGPGRTINCKECEFSRNYALAWNESGNATAATATTYTDTGQSWPTDRWVNSWILIDPLFEGAWNDTPASRVPADCAGEILQITSNTSDTITTAAWSGCTPAATDPYVIIWGGHGPVDERDAATQDGTSNTVTVTGGTFGINTYQNSFLICDPEGIGPADCTGEQHQITSHTDTVFTTAGSWTNEFNSGDRFIISVTINDTASGIRTGVDSSSPRVFNNTFMGFKNGITLNGEGGILAYNIFKYGAYDGGYDIGSGAAASVSGIFDINHNRAFPTLLATNSFNFNSWSTNVDHLAVTDNQIDCGGGTSATAISGAMDVARGNYIKDCGTAIFPQRAYSSVSQNRIIGANTTGILLSSVNSVNLFDNICNTTALCVRELGTTDFTVAVGNVNEGTGDIRVGTLNGGTGLESTVLGSRDANNVTINQIPAVTAFGGHISSTEASGTPVVSACGSTPVPRGVDSFLSITIGSGAGIQSCLVTFDDAFAFAPACSVTGNGVSATSYHVATTTTTATITTPDTTMGGDIVNLICADLHE